MVLEKLLILIKFFIFIVFLNIIKNLVIIFLISFCVLKLIVKFKILVFVRIGVKLRLNFFKIIMVIIN